MMTIIKMEKNITFIAMILIIITINNDQLLKPKKILKARDMFTRYFIAERETPI